MAEDATQNGSLLIKLKVLVVVRDQSSILTEPKGANVQSLWIDSPTVHVILTKF